MTQEELAAILDVSVDAISKYERSLSYMRGDLEHQLIDKLGWSQQDVLACREDWEASRSQQPASSYRLFSNMQILQEFGGNTSAVSEAISGMETETGNCLPNGFSASDKTWKDVQSSGLIWGSYVMHGQEMVGHVGLIFPNSVLERQFRKRLFDESEIHVECLRRPILPGEYFAYCPAIYIAQGHECIARLLLSGFIFELESFLDREIVIREIAAMSVNPLGRQLCEDLGLAYHGDHSRYPGFGLWSMTGGAIASSLLGRRSARLRQAYRGLAPSG